MMGSKSDEEFCKKIGDHCKKLGLPFKLRVSSAHKSTEDVLQVISDYESRILFRQFSVYHVSVSYPTENPSSKLYFSRWS